MRGPWKNQELWTSLALELLRNGSKTPAPEKPQTKEAAAAYLSELWARKTEEEKNQRGLLKRNSSFKTP